MSQSDLDGLQKLLNNHEETARSAASGSSVPGASQPVESSLTTGPYAGSQASTTTATTGLYARNEKDKTRGFQSKGLRHRGLTDTNARTSPNVSTWVLPIFHNERYAMKVEHLPVNMALSDLALFELLKKRYNQTKSTTRRLLAMRGVKKISFVKVHGNLFRLQTSY